MEDYISILLGHLREQCNTLGGWPYAIQQQRTLQAQTALASTLSAAQQQLLLAYEEESALCAGIREDAYARAAFLLARELFR